MNPRYLRNHPNIEIALRAEAVLERELGHKFAATEYTDTLRYTERGASLPKTPVVSLVSIRARTSSWGPHPGLKEVFGTTDWTDIDVNHTVLHQKDGKAALILPMSMFGGTYEEVQVTYIAGNEHIPADLLEAAATIYELYASGDIDEWNSVLPEHVYQVLHRYRKEDYR